MNIDDNISFDPVTGNFIKLPVITLFFADRTVIADEGPITINWEVEDAAKVYLNRKQVAKKGKQQFICRETTLFSLLATTENEFAVKRELKVEVDNRPPVIEWFRIDTDFAIIGSPVKLSWSIKSARSIRIDNGVGDVTGLSSKMVTLGSSGVYILTANNYFWGSVKAEASVAVFPLPLIKGIFVPEPAFNLSMPVINKPLPTIFSLQVNPAPQFNAKPILIKLSTITIYEKAKLFNEVHGTEPFFMPGSRS